jgi:hypothetical protein
VSWYSRHDPVKDARDRRQHAWWQFRRKLGLSNVEIVARLLDVSVRSIQRYETAERPPAWYQAALLGLVETFPDRKKARLFKPHKPKDPNRYDPGPKSVFETWDPVHFKRMSIPR